VAHVQGKIISQCGANGRARVGDFSAGTTDFSIWRVQRSSPNVATWRACIGIPNFGSWFKEMLVVLFSNDVLNIGLRSGFRELLEML
jgi:hypothetical protein